MDAPFSVLSLVRRLAGIMTQLIITAVGPDRPGIVGELTGHLHGRGGNILDSRMVNLRGRFAIVMLLEIGSDAAATLSKELPQVGQSTGLVITAVPQSPSH